MRYSDDDADKVPVSSLSFSDLVAASFALAVGSAAFMLIFFSIAYAIGLPGPLIWMGSDNVAADILMVPLATAPFLFFGNCMGAFVVASFFAGMKKLRSR